jgi:hypothetical protein
LAVKGWTEFQHYKHRKPPWIRLHRKLLDDMDWHELPAASRLLAPMLWLLASETMNGVIDGDSKAIAFRLRVASTEFEEAIKPLIAGGWFLVIEPASGVLAPRLQDAPSESEFRVTDTLTSNLTDPASGAALRLNGSAPLARQPRQTAAQRVAQLAEASRQKAGNA